MRELLGFFGLWLSSVKTWFRNPDFFRHQQVDRAAIEAIMVTSFRDGSPVAALRGAELAAFLDRLTRARARKTTKVRAEYVVTVQLRDGEPRSYHATRRLLRPRGAASDVLDGWQFEQPLFADVAA